MDNIAQFVSGPFVYFLAFIFVLTVVVFIHELGHFLIARCCGVKVTAFSIGFGPEIFGRNDRYGTRWKLCLIPLGGYVKFLDDDSISSLSAQSSINTLSEAEKEGCFHNKPVWKRALVVFAGPAANFILAIVIFTMWFLIQGIATTEPRIDEIVPNGAADRAGLKAGDLVLEINEKPIASFEDIQRFVATNVGNSLDFKIERNGNYSHFFVIPEVLEQIDDKGDKGQMVMIGVKRSISAQSIKVRKPDFIEAIGYAGDKTLFIVTSTLGYLSDVLLGKQSASQLGGPIRIADIAGRVAQQGGEYLIQLVAFISVSVGLINLFPIPLLDGGHLVFYAVEAVRGKPLTERAPDIAFRIGMAVLVSLMFFSTFNDLHIIKRWVFGNI
ncbi:MAG: RIP metalloprotease RseP [Hyphomicrobium sp.]